MEENRRKWKKMEENGRSIEGNGRRMEDSMTHMEENRMVLK